EPRDGTHPVGAPELNLAEILAPPAERTPDVGARLGESKSRRRDPDDRARLAVEHRRRADDRTVGAEPLAPEMIADHHDVGAAAPRLVEPKGSAELRRHTEDRKEVAGHRMHG